MLVILHPFSCSLALKYRPKSHSKSSKRPFFLLYINHVSNKLSNKSQATVKSQKPFEAMYKFLFLNFVIIWAWTEKAKKKFF